MSNSDLWQIRYRLTDASELELYTNKLREISGATVVLAVSHHGSETVFKSSTDTLDATVTHMHALLHIPVACSLYKAKQLISRTGIYTEPPGSLLGSRDKSVSIATDISGAMAYFLWEFARNPTKLSFTQGRVIVDPSTCCEDDIITVANSHYEAKRGDYNRRHKKQRTARTDVLQSFLTRYASGYNKTFDKLYVEYSEALFQHKVFNVSNFLMENDCLKIWCHTPERRAHIAKQKARQLMEKYDL